MTAALCTNCGEFKMGAWTYCPGCGSKGLNDDVSLALSDWYLSNDELQQISKVGQLIFKTELHEALRFNFLVYYLSKKWPKLLQYSIDELDPKIQKQIVDFYTNKLSDFQGQE